MEEIKVPPEPIDIEKTFDKFVEIYGGKCIKNLIPKNPNFKNADYIFHNEKLIAELKCFKKNQLEDKNYIIKIEQTFQRWIKKGKIGISQLEDWKIGNFNLPDYIYTDIVKITKPIIEDSLRKAKHQLFETKRYFGVNDFYSIVLVVNDGNYTLHNREMYWLIGNILTTPKFRNSCIDGYVYITVNLTSKIPNSNLDWTIWAPAYNGDDKEELSKIVNKIGEKWHIFLKYIFNEPEAPFIQTDDGGFIDRMKLIPKNFYKRNS